MTVRGVSSSIETCRALGFPPTTTPVAPAGIHVVWGLAMGIRSWTRMPRWTRVGARQRGTGAIAPRSEGRNQKSRRKSWSATARTIGRRADEVKQDSRPAAPRLWPHGILSAISRGGALRCAPPGRPDVETLAADRLQALATRIFAALGVPDGDAAWVAELLVRANLRGHDSHGVIRVPQYVGSIRKGETNPRPAMRVLAETPTTAIVDGDLGLGQVVARRATEVALDKAARLGLAAVGTRRSNHIGRLADYAELAAAQGFVGLVWTNAPTAQSVVPHGGLDRRLSTNPLAVAVPGPDGGVAISVDMASSIVAEGKVRVKRNRKEPLPDGWAIDPAGRTVTDSEGFYGPPRAGLLPAGGHKGTALGLIVEVLGGILSGEGAIGDRTGPVHNGTFLLLIEVARFLPLVDFTGQVTDLVRWVKSSAPAPGVAEVLVPGEPEARSEAHRRTHGIPVEVETWRQIEEIAAELGVG
jgi:hydroxycarboxylate dehydrogenase B